MASSKPTRGWRSVNTRAMAGWRRGGKVSELSPLAPEEQAFIGIAFLITWPDMQRV